MEIELIFTKKKNLNTYVKVTYCSMERFVSFKKFLEKENIHVDYTSGIVFSWILSQNNNINKIKNFINSEEFIKECQESLDAEMRRIGKMNSYKEKKQKISEDIAFFEEKYPEFKNILRAYNDETALCDAELFQVKKLFDCIINNEIKMNIMTTDFYFNYPDEHMIFMFNENNEFETNTHTIKLCEYDDDDDMPGACYFTIKSLNLK